MTMFHLEAVCLIAVICVVNAALTVNVYEDDVEGIKDHDLASCNAVTCDQLCRRLGFHRGRCIGNTCECSGLLADENMNESEVSNGIDDIKGDDFADCNQRSCGIKCRRQNLRGVCINGHCKCFRLVKASITTYDLDKDVIVRQPQGCNPMACDQLCRRLKFHGGVCVNGRCKCDNFKETEESVLENTLSAYNIDQYSISKELHDCNPMACDQLCRRLKFPGGVCVNGHCKCDNFKETEVSNLIQELINPEVDNGLVDTNEINSCDDFACSMGCRSIGYPGGSCFLGKCRCNPKVAGYKFNGLKSLGGCEAMPCSNMCRRLHYFGGWCRFDRCECF